MPLNYAPRIDIKGTGMSIRDGLSFGDHGVARSVTKTNTTCPGPSCDKRHNLCGICYLSLWKEPRGFSGPRTSYEPSETEFESPLPMDSKNAVGDSVQTHSKSQNATNGAGILRRRLPACCTKAWLDRSKLGYSKLCHHCAAWCQSLEFQILLVKEKAEIEFSVVWECDMETLRGDEYWETEECAMCRLIALQVFNKTGYTLCSEIVDGVMRSWAPLKFTNRRQRIQLHQIRQTSKTELEWYQVADLKLTLPTGSQYDNASLVGLFGPNLNPDSPESWQKIESWMQQCDQHDNCSKIECLPLPRRVIDVLSSPPKLCSYLAIKDKYTALSYCWGGDQKFKCTTKNIDQYSRGLPIKDLPQTIKDAITITRKLKIPYLWIDSLCILQNDMDEMRQEIMNMGKVYQNCTVTIVAASARTANEGFLMPRIPVRGQVHLPLVLKTREDDITGPVTLSPCLDSLDYFKRNPIESRGWTLQERLLSPRMLIYSSTNLRWLCRSAQDYDGGSSTMLGSHNLPPPATAVRSADIDYGWHAIVSEFSRRDLTDEHDKFPAIAAIAREYGGSDSYLAGLWKSNLAADLLWFIQGGETLRRPRNYRAPSWSWAALDEPIGWMEAQSDDEFIPDPIFEYLGYTPHFKHIEAPFSGLEGAKLRVRGRLTCLGSVKRINQSMSTVLFLDEGNKADYLEVYGLLLGKRKHRAGCLGILRSALNGLFLAQEIVNGKKVYRRVGVFFDSFIKERHYEHNIIEELELL